jgi:hypothetical protein
MQWDTACNQEEKGYNKESRSSDSKTADFWCNVGIFS